MKSLIENSYKKQVESANAKEEAKTKDPNDVEQPGRTLTDIIADKSESAIFGSFLKKEGPSGVELAERLAKNELRAEDLKALEVRRLEHIQKMHEVEGLEKQMTPEYVANFAKYSPKFQEIVNLIGPEKAASALQSQMRELLVSDQDRFNNLSNKMKELMTFRRGELSDTDKAIIEECKKNGVSEADFMKALAMEDEEERKEFLKGHVRNSYKWYKKGADFITFGKWSKEDAKNLAAKKDDMDAVLETLNNHISGVGGMLEDVVDGNDAVRGAFAAEIIGEKIPKPEPQKTFKEARSEKATEEKMIDDEWLKYKAAVKFDTLATQPEKDAEIAKFRQQMIDQEKEKNKKKGFWASLFASLFESTVKSKELK